MVDRVSAETVIRAALIARAASVLLTASSGGLAQLERSVRLAAPRLAQRHAAGILAVVPHVGQDSVTANVHLVQDGAGHAGPAEGSSQPNVRAPHCFLVVQAVMSQGERMGSGGDDAGPWDDAGTSII